MQGVIATVLAMQAALQQTFVLELVRVGDHTARQYSESLSKRRLTHAGPNSQDLDHARVRWSEFEHGQPVCEPGCGVRANLRQQRCGVWDRLRFQSGGVYLCHVHRI